MVIVRLSIKHHPPTTHLHMLASGSGDVRRLWQPRLVDPLRGLDDFVQLRRDFGWGHTAAEDVPRRNGRTVEVLVGVFALDKDCAFQRQPGEQT